VLDGVLVANRGEIAVRVMRACRELGVGTVGVYQPNDADSFHAELADEAVELEDDRGYLDIDGLVDAALRHDVEAIHPGYGYLAENAEFARRCEQAGITFVGPCADSIEAMGVKTRARTTMRQADVPVVPGSTTSLEDPGEARRTAGEIGYPVMVKAAAGGGGIGIRVVHDGEEMERALESARSQAERAFGRSELYLEKHLERPRHVEIQVLADARGNTVHLGERDCSLQRRRQKILEEGPSPAVDGELRDRMGRMAVRAARAVDYRSAGTVECLLDREGNYYFLEMNTRIQVEHPVTEMLTGIDLVKEQLKVAAGQPLSIDQQDVELEGHAIECRINAEKPFENFRPDPGTLERFQAPHGPWTRMDTFVESGYEVTPHFDPLLGKLIVWGADREEALARMRRALNELRVEGISTTAEVHRPLLEDADVRAGDYHVQFLEDWVDERAS